MQEALRKRPAAGAPRGSEDLEEGDDDNQGEEAFEELSEKEEEKEEGEQGCTENVERQQTVFQEALQRPAGALELGEGEGESESAKGEEASEEGEQAWCTVFF